MFLHQNNVPAISQPPRLLVGAALGPSSCRILFQVFPLDGEEGAKSHSLEEAIKVCWRLWNFGGNALLTERFCAFPVELGGMANSSSAHQPSTNSWENPNAYVKFWLIFYHASRSSSNADDTVGGSEVVENLNRFRYVLE